MTPERQRIAIAEWEGWKLCSAPIKGGTIHQWWEHPDMEHFHKLPDYLNDLNAMHEAEKKLRRAPDTYQPGGIGYYLCALAEINEEPILATAAQRAEALLKTIGKWEEE